MKHNFCYNFKAETLAQIIIALSLLPLLNFLCKCHMDYKTRYTHTLRNMMCYTTSYITQGSEDDGSLF